LYTLAALHVVKIKNSPKAFNLLTIYIFHKLLSKFRQILYNCTWSCATGTRVLRQAG
jgi:hypothetical protein